MCFIGFLTRLDTPNAIALISALTAVVMAVLAFIKAFGRERKVNRLVLEDMQARVEDRKKALLELSPMCRDPYTMLISNVGEATALNVRVQMLESEDETGVYLLTSPEMMPYPILHKGGSFGIRGAITEGHKLIVPVRLVWDDDYAKSRERIVMLNLL